MTDLTSYSTARFRNGTLSTSAVGNLGAPLHNLFDEEMEEVVREERGVMHIMSDPLAFGLPIVDDSEGVGLVRQE